MGTTTLAVVCLTLATSRGLAQVVATNTFDDALRRGDSAWSAESYPAAHAAYAQAVAIDSTRSSRAVFRLATIDAWDNRLDAAIAGFRRYLALEPHDDEGRVALARTLADAARYGEAVAVYDSVLARDSTYRDATLGRAQALARASDYNAAMDAYQRWLTLHANDPDARLGLARTLSLAGRLDAAEVEYRSLLRSHDRLDAEIGLARVAAWRGDLGTSESRWRAVLAQTPDDPEALTGLAQTLLWEGNPRLARTMLRRALAMQPAYGDAQALGPWIDAALASTMRPSVDHLTDSDGNNVTTATVDASTEALWNGRLGATVRRRSASFHGTSASSTSAVALTDWTSHDGGVVVRATGGAAKLTGGCSGTPVACDHRRALSTIATGSVSLRLGISASLDASVSRLPFDATRTLIANRLVIEGADGAFRWTFPAAVTLSGALGRARVTGGIPNQRTSYDASLRRAWSRRVSLAAGVRGFGYDTTTTEGYFAPHHYLLAEGSARFVLGRDLGWFLSGEAGVGEQRIDFRGASSQRMAARARLSPGWRWRPGAEAGLDVTASNVAMPQQLTPGEYRSLTVGVRALVSF